MHIYTFHSHTFLSTCEDVYFSFLAHFWQHVLKRVWRPTGGNELLCVETVKHIPSCKIGTSAAEANASRANLEEIPVGWFPTITSSNSSNNTTMQSVRSTNVPSRPSSSAAITLPCKLRCDYRANDWNCNTRSSSLSSFAAMTFRMWIVWYGCWCHFIFKCSTECWKMSHEVLLILSVECRTPWVTRRWRCQMIWDKP